MSRVSLQGGATNRNAGNVVNLTFIFYFVQDTNYEQSFRLHSTQNYFTTDLTEKQFFSYHYYYFIRKISKLQGITYFSFGQKLID